MDLWKKIRGITGNIFGVGGTSGVNVKDNSGVVEMRNSGDTDFVTSRSSNIQLSNTINDNITLLEVIHEITFSFTGGSPPSPGANTNAYGICHTTGGSYSAGDVVYDNGSSLITVLPGRKKCIFTTTAISGTVSFNANGVYIGLGTSWSLKGDGTPTNSGFVKIVEVDYNYTNVTVDSTTQLVSGSVVLQTSNVIVTPFNGPSPSTIVTVNGSSPLTLLAAGDSNPAVSAQYLSDEQIGVGVTNAGSIRVTVATGSTAGQGIARVQYTVSAGA